MKKIFALTAISVALLGAGCSSDDDDAGGTTGGTTGETTTGGTDGGNPMPAMAVLPAADAYDPASQDPVPTLTLVELLAATPTLTTLAAAAGNCPAVAAAASDADARLTVFAPSDAAFTSAAYVAAAAEADFDACEVIAGHILVGTVADGATLAGQTGTVATTLGMTNVALESTANGGLTVGGSLVTVADNFATNGVAHIIDTVILPMEETGGETGGTDAGTGTDTGTTTGTGGGDFGPVGTTFQSTAAVSVFAGNFLTAFDNSLDGVDGGGVPNTWTVFAPTDAALTAASVTNADIDGPVRLRHIHTGESLTEAQLGALTSIQMTNGSATYDVAVDGTGAITVGGLPVTLITTGQSTVYQIDGVLPAQ